MLHDVALPLGQIVFKLSALVILITLLHVVRLDYWRLLLHVRDFHERTIIRVLFLSGVLRLQRHFLVVLLCFVIISHIGHVAFVLHRLHV